MAESDATAREPKTGLDIDLRDGYKWGYDLYPERTGRRKPTFYGWFFENQPREKIDQYKCEKRLHKIYNESPLLRIMKSALSKAGCPLNLRRHFSCEFCAPYVTGGYDPIYNQIVICSNMCTSKAAVHSVAYHELLHMFDYCNHELDFKNIDHVACTEIRAANLTYCSFLSAYVHGHMDRTKLKAQEKECVKRRALESVLAVREVSHEEATAAVNRVFDKCYVDREPVGRRVRRSSNDADLAYAEAFLLGYD